uniref:Uncharacterized protein LOC114332850 n=1 Tax=Diabrotica virgifera virgifera TaxID=50390 RepID=A0A6P7G031_DIAVI
MKLLGKVLVILLIGYSNMENIDSNKFDPQNIDFDRFDRHKFDIDKFDMPNIDFEEIHKRINDIQENKLNIPEFNFKPYDINQFDINQYKPISLDGSNFWEDVPKDPNAYLEYLQEECSNAGHPDILNMNSEIYRQAKICLGSRADYIETIAKQLIDSGLIAISQIDVKEFCKVWPEVHNCINPLVSSVKECLNSDLKEIVDGLLKFIDESKSFFCVEDRISTLVINGSVQQCFSLVSKDLNECQNNFKNGIGQFIQTKEIYKDADTYKLLTGKSLDDARCSTFKSFRDCSVSKLTKCESKDPSKIVDDYLALIEDDVHCSVSWFSRTNIKIFYYAAVTVICLIILGIIACFKLLKGRSARTQQQLFDSHMKASNTASYTHV